MKLKQYKYYDRDGITIFCGDAFEILPQLEVGSADVCLTDPDYNGKDIGVYSRKYLSGEMSIEVEAYKDMCRRWFTEINRITPNIMVSPGIRNVWNYPPAKWMLCWHKPGAVCYNATGGFNIWEPILVYGKCGRFTEDYICSPPQNLRKGVEQGHPCPKNINVWNWLVKNGTKEGQIIIDCFAGAGTTAVSCKKFGRKCILIERVPEYCEIAVKRLAQEVLL